MAETIGSVGWRKLSGITGWGEWHMTDFSASLNHIRRFHRKNMG